MKRYLIILLFSSVVFANIDHKKDLLIDKLLNDVASLKKEISLLKQQQKENKDLIDDAFDFAEDVEAKNLKDRLEIGLGFKNDITYFNKKYADKSSVVNSNIFSSKLMLNLRADIVKNINFYGKLSMYKYWGSSYVHQYSYYDNMQGRVPSNSALYVERSYINWFFYKDSKFPMALTIGRQPSSNGPSYQFKTDTKRKGTYSALLYDGAADGVVFTMNLSNILDLKRTYLRLGYAKGFGYVETSLDVHNAYIGSVNNKIKDTDVFGIFFDSSLFNIDNSLVQFSFSKMKNIVANPLDSNDSTNVNIGDLDLIGFSIELQKVADSNFDIFMHYGYSKSYPNAKTYIDYGGLLSKTSTKNYVNGHAIWLGSRYSFGSKHKYKIGAEYNYGTRYWINITQGASNLYNKLATRGSAYELYAIYVLNRYTNIRLGYINIDYNYSGSGWFVGDSSKIDKSMSNADSIVDNLESIYLKMSINF